MASERSLVVLVHGFLGSRLQQVPLAARLSLQHDVFNYGYRSRGDTLRNHAAMLRDAVHSRVASDEPPHRVHFVTHSFGGVVLHRAFQDGLSSSLPNEGRDTRCVLLGPPLRGAMLARAFRRDRVGLSGTAGDAVHAAARLVLGEFSGTELMTHDEQWFEHETGQLPAQVSVLVVAGAWPGSSINPLVSGESDGVVAVRETFMRRPHARMTVPFSHNYLLYSGMVMGMVSEFLSGAPVGEDVDGAQLGLR